MLLLRLLLLLILLGSAPARALRHICATRTTQSVNPSPVLC